jgi:hypothetical protein
VPRQWLLFSREYISVPGGKSNRKLNMPSLVLTSISSCDREYAMHALKAFASSNILRLFSGVDQSMQAVSARVPRRSGGRRELTDGSGAVAPKPALGVVAAIRLIARGQ